IVEVAHRHLRVELTGEVEELEEDRPLLLEDLERIVDVELIERHEEAIGRQVDRVLRAIGGDVLEVHARLPHFDAVARTKLFSQDEDAVDERAVAALEVDDLVDSVAADDLAMSA